MKKISLLLITTAALLGLVGCKNSGDEPLADSDFDGLRNEIDPDKDNNEYFFHVEDKENKRLTIQDSFEMDYREFLRDDLITNYNPKLGKLASLILNESYEANIVIENNVYVSDSTSKSKLLTQIGCEDIEVKDFRSMGYSQDKNDIVNMKLGHHVVTNKTDRLNVVFVEIIGYPTDAGWASNFDVGADGQDYIDTTGEHDDWLDKKDHKGFDISAKRAFDYIKTYTEAHKVVDTNDLIFVIGQSRGGATSSLIGKKLKDNNFNSLVYAFNTPLHTSDTSEEVLASYDNIWQIVNEEDFVSRVPVNAWNNFSLLGHVLEYKMSEHKDLYNKYFTTRSFPEIDPDLVSTLEDGIAKLAETREDLYKFREADPDYDEVILKFNSLPFDSKEDAEEEIEEYYDAFADGEAARKIIYMEAQPYTDNPSKYQINYKTKPQIIISIINDVLGAGSASVDSVAATLMAYLPFIGRYLSDLSTELTYLVTGLPDSLNQIVASHEPLICLLACTLFD